MKIVERIVMVLIALALIAGAGWFYLSIKHKQQEVRDAVARGEYEIRQASTTTETTDEDWRTYFPTVVPIVIASTTMYASIADDLPSRIKGLSGTPYLPQEVVKLFAFGAAGEQSIWMKDMLYPLDIMWLNKEGVIVHIAENIAPDTYPKSFSSPSPAWYVIEANAGFVASSSIKKGDKVVIPQ
jgi:uncharacterized membrane protein (UPF0127 family)